MKIEKTWTTREGNEAVVLLVDNSHRCGYVGFDKNHLAYNAEYDMPQFHHIFIGNYHKTPLLKLG